MTAYRVPLINPSKRTNVTFLENACVKVSDGALIYKKIEDGAFSDYNIPYANTSMVLLGRDVDISHDGMRRLSENGVMVCLCGNGEASNDADPSKHFMAIEPQIERRTDQYMQLWGGIFLDGKRKVDAAKMLLRERIKFTEMMWEKLPEASDYGLYFEELKSHINSLLKVVNDDATTTSQPLKNAAQTYEKNVFSFAAPLFGFSERRQPGNHDDILNRYLDIANYFAYGYAAIVLHGLAIPFSFSLLHGQTSRNGLIFDVADLIRDGICMPIALEAAMSGREEGEMCNAIRHAMQEQDILDHLFKTLKRLCEQC